MGFHTTRVNRLTMSGIGFLPVMARNKGWKPISLLI
ncbi:hypothetical protein RB11649 [Rhodopirellula baltica SH 1]|uniref:Uncharacterized protein n=1 Tax=Rhodopirellula baltica (strain DSM 10527 / NCIMB 13988 / SH1) TaxID=243090 RepID=Q7UE15_RHOBA|nr:hypothetical protein RB11649 [Rhodopirellula baltica SH 1]